MIHLVCNVPPGLHHQPGIVPTLTVITATPPIPTVLPCQCHQLPPVFLDYSAAGQLLLRPLLALQLLTGLVGVEVTEVTGEGIVGFEFLLTDDADVFQVLEIFLEILIVLVTAAAVGLAVELEFVLLEQLQLAETDLTDITGVDGRGLPLDGLPGDGLREVGDGYVSVPLCCLWCLSN